MASLPWRVAWCLAWAASAALAVVVAGCAGGGARRPAEGMPSWAMAEEPPGDFTLSVTVFPPEESRASGEPLPRYLRGLRAIVQPDLSLRAREGRVDVRTYPTLTRTLTPEQYRRLWWDLRDSGFLQEGRVEEVSSPEAAAPGGDAPPRRGLYVISYLASGHRRTLAIDPVLSDGAPAARRLVDRLAALAWIE